MSKIRFGYVGCGGLAQRVHHPNFKSLPECDFLALSDLRPELLAKVADRLGVPRRYKNHLEMAEDGDIEAVGISSSFSVQGELAIDFLQRGKAVFLEKPMATSAAQAQRLLKAARDGGGRLMIGYMYRYDAGNQLAREWIRQFRQSQELGKITFIRIHGFGGDWMGGLDTPLDETTEAYPPANFIGPDWLPGKWLSPYINYLQQFTHNINLTRWFLDSTKKAEVRFVDLDENGYGGTVLLDYEGIRCSLESGLIDYHGWDDHTQFYFDKGWVKRSAPSILLRNVPCDVEIYRSVPRRELIRPIPEPAWTWSYKREAAEFLKAVQTGQPFESSGEDALLDVELFEDIYRQWLLRRGEIRPETFSPNSL